LIGSLTALENVELPMILMGGKSRDEIRRRATELLAKVGLKHRMDHFPNQLSGGEQQRVTIARALANNPKVLLLDEPTGDLDTKNTDIVLDLLVELNRKDGITMIMVTHDVGLKNFADRIIWMRDGKIQRIEIVPKDKKVEAIKRNQEDLNELKVSKNPDMGFSEGSRIRKELFEKTKRNEMLEENVAKKQVLNTNLMRGVMTIFNNVSAVKDYLNLNKLEEIKLKQHNLGDVLLFCGEVLEILAKNREEPTAAKSQPLSFMSLSDDE